MRRLLLSVLLALVLILTVSVPARAITSPANPSTINGVWIYTGVLETGDIGIFVDYFIDYATDFTPPLRPAETATDSFLAIFIDIDGTTQLRATAPISTVNPNRGYRRGAAWIYFSAAEVTLLGIANNPAYRLWVMGNPTLAWAGELTNGTGIATGAPIALASGNNTINVTGAGTFTVTLPTGGSGTATSGTATVVGSPQALVAGTNTVDTGATTGTFTVNVVPGPPPKTIGTVSYWQSSGTTSVLLAQIVLQMAQVLEDAWSADTGTTIDLVAATSIGNRLTTTGESYFMNVIPNLRTAAPSAFAANTAQPTKESIDYSTSFGATMTNGTGQFVGSPKTLTSGLNTENVTVNGTFILALNTGTVGEARSVVGGGTVTGSPVTLKAGSNTITTTGIGDIAITVSLQDTTAKLGNSVIGTGFDLTPLAQQFGVSRELFSGLVWLALSVVICASLYRKPEPGEYQNTSNKAVLIVFDLCIIGGAVLGLIVPLIAVLLFIGFMALTGYVLFFRNANV